MAERCVRFGQATISARHTLKWLCVADEPLGEISLDAWNFLMLNGLLLILLLLGLEFFSLLHFSKNVVRFDVLRNKFF